MLVFRNTLKYLLCCFLKNETVNSEGSAGFTAGCLAWRGTWACQVSVFLRADVLCGTDRFAHTQLAQTHAGHAGISGHMPATHGDAAHGG